MSEFNLNSTSQWKNIKHCHQHAINVAELKVIWQIIHSGSKKEPWATPTDNATGSKLALSKQVTGQTRVPRIITLKLVTLRDRMLGMHTGAYPIELTRRDRYCNYMF